MSSVPPNDLARRDFLKLAGAVSICSLSPNAFAAGEGGVSIIIDAANEAASTGPVKRAMEKLQSAFKARGISCQEAHTAEAASGSSFSVVVCDAESQLAQGFPSVPALTTPESLRLIPGHLGRTPAVLISAKDPRGFVYGLLELAERAQFSTDPLAALHLAGAVEEKPANELRGVGRYFCSELEDKPWYYDKAFWSGYLDRLVASRFNRFTMAFGLEYDFPRGVTDDYFHFVYPYLFDVPGYQNVRVVQLAAADGTRLAVPVPLSRAERSRNLEMLRFIAAETGARGLHFQLAIWTHAYQWTDSPNAYHRIEGITADNHARYCRDALAILLKEIPEIQGLTMRVHGESGIPEGSYSFWSTVFEAIANAGRDIEIDMHAKGVDQGMIETAAGAARNIKLGAKYSAEHQSLGYQQADIRALEIPRENPAGAEQSVFKFSSGSRSFTRYGYADFLRQGARAQVLFRLWPGTQRHLLSVDPETIGNYSRTAHFCGAIGLDLMEPLTFKGREGSGLPGGRCAYADISLNPDMDWKKYDYYYRVWGRKLYDPDADPEAWRRCMRSEFGSGAAPTETALACASRILALLTSAHLDSASNHDLWYEMPTNMPIVLGSEPSPYGDTPTPKCFGTVSPLDPQMFSTVVEYTHTLLAGQTSAKYSPIEVAQWIEHCLEVSTQALNEAHRSVRPRTSPAFRRVEEDVLIQIGLGRFFAYKLRSSVLCEIFQQTGSSEAGGLAVAQYQNARDAWAAMADRANRVYRANVSYGDVPKRRGHWSDRLADIDLDLTAMKAKVKEGRAVKGSGQNPADAIRAATGKPQRPEIPCTHTAPDSFIPGHPLSLTLAISSTFANSVPKAVRMFFRHVDQAERWASVAMHGDQGQYTAVIPSEYTKSDFGLQYYFEVEDGKGFAWMYPGLNKALSNQPYFSVCRRRA
jgi:hypothetical protein